VIYLKSLDMRITTSHTPCSTADVTEEKNILVSPSVVPVLSRGLRTTDREICSISHVCTATFQNTPWSTRYHGN